MCRYRQTIANLRSAGAAHLTSPPPKEGYGAGTYLRIWLRRLDSNQRPLGYGPNELPTATTPPFLLDVAEKNIAFLTRSANRELSPSRHTTHRRPTPLWLSADTGGHLAGMAGFEPTNARVKVWCLTAWRHPNICLKLSAGGCPARIATQRT